jgi:hypothetical protein
MAYKKALFTNMHYLTRENWRYVTWPIFVPAKVCKQDEEEQTLIETIPNYTGVRYLQEWVKFIYRSVFALVCNACYESRHSVLLELCVSA